MKLRPNLDRGLLKSRILCSIAWVILTCWPDWAFASSLVISLWSVYLGGVLLLMLITIVLYAVAFWLLMRWTARVYATEESSRFRHSLQIGLVLFSMLLVYIINQAGGDLRQMGFFSVTVPSNQIAFGEYITSYGRAWIEMVVLQYIAIRFNRFFLRPLQRRNKYEESDYTDEE